MGYWVKWPCATVRGILFCPVSHGASCPNSQHDPIAASARTPKSAAAREVWPATVREQKTAARFWSRRKRRVRSQAVGGPGYPGRGRGLAVTQRARAALNVPGTGFDPFLRLRYAGMRCPVPKVPIMIEVMTPVKTRSAPLTVAVAPRAAHLCNVYPDWYPTGGPPLAAGLIHDTAAQHLAVFLRDHLHAIDYARAIVAVDVLFHTKPPRNHDGTLEYTRPDVMAYRQPRPDLEPAGAFHLDNDGPPDLAVEILSRSTWRKDIGIGEQIAAKMRHYQRIGVREYWIYNPERLQAKQGVPLFQGFRLQGAIYTPIEPRGRYWPSAVLGTRWVVGDTQRTTKDETFPLMRLCRPRSRAWYPTAAEKDAASARKDEALAEKDEALAEKDEALAEKDEALAKALTEKDEALTEKDEALALLAQYRQRFGSLENDAPSP